MLGNIEVENLTTIMSDHEEAVEHTEGDGWHREEIHRRDGFTVIPQKCEPTFGQFRVSRRSFHPTRNGSLGNVKPKHHEFAMNARGTPGRVLRDHAKV